MAHLTFFPGNREIIEIEEEEEEVNKGEHYKNNNYKRTELKREERDRSSLASNAGRVSSLEEDLNQLFEIFNRRTSSHGSPHPSQASTSKKKSSKKPSKTGGPHSPGHGISERVNLKQALRGLCLSQASEMAAMKRSAKGAGSSEAGRIMTMYRNVVVEDSISEHSQDDGRGGMLEISLVPEKTSFDSFRNLPETSPSSDLWPSNRSSLAERGGSTRAKSDRKFETKDSISRIPSPEKHVAVMSPSSPRFDGNISNSGHSVSTRHLPSDEVGNQRSSNGYSHNKMSTHLSFSSSPAKSNVRETSKSRITEKERLSPSPNASPSNYGKAPFEPVRKMPAPKEIVAVAVGTESQTSMDKLHKDDNARFLHHSDHGAKAWDHSKSYMTENEKFSSSAELASQSSLTDSLPKEKHASPYSSPSTDGKTSLELTMKLPERKDMNSIVVGAGSQMKAGVLHKPEQILVHSPRRSDLGEEASDSSKKNPSPNKSLNNEPVAKAPNGDAKDLGLGAAQKGSSKIVPSSDSPKGKKSSKSARNAHHFIRPIIKTRNFVKRKSKKNVKSDKSSKTTHCEFNNDLYSNPNPIVCPRCQCVVTDAWKEANQESPITNPPSPVLHQESPISHDEAPVYYEDSPVSPFVSLSAEVSSGNVISDVSTPGPSYDSSNKSKAITGEAQSNKISREKGDLTRSSKDSPGECSSSTCGSEESNPSRPSICDRPHMSKDARWEAIRHVKYQHGTLGLRDFNLLKKLGCGDIGTVYLAELIGTNCLFAIKVMDNEFLVRRKKIVRAQTEKEILRMLDHPFLPTLYCQFTSDNLSCLVMEYCPGGDLHVLRQRQPGRCFTEHATRFYVAEVLLALEYLHMLGVVYRDLKPENILVRDDGHIMLSDFDLSLRCVVSPTLLVSSSMSEASRKKAAPTGPCVDSRCVQPLCIEPSCQVTCFTPRLLASSSKLKKQKSDLASEMRPLLQLVAEPTSARSNSFVGTHEYLAPEIIKGEGHGSAVDWWTFGIFLYELLYGRTPFKGTGNEETLANVVLQSLKFPDSPLVSLQARDLIAALLVKEPEERLGTERGAAEIKQHPFFEGLNWALIRCAVPPELPELRSYGAPKRTSQDKYNSGSAEHLEFEVF